MSDWSRLPPELLNLISEHLGNFQIVLLGRQYGMVSYDPDSLALKYRGVAFLPLTNKGGGEFVVLLGYSNDLLVLTSAEMRWKRLEHASIAWCIDVVTFRGRFYVLQLNGYLFVIDPYLLELTPIMLQPSGVQDCGTWNILVPSGVDELYLVQNIIPRNYDLDQLACHEETGEWVVVTDLGDRVLLIGPPGNRTCLGKDLPDGCGVSGNSILFTDEEGGLTWPFKYGVDTRYEESCDDPQCISEACPHEITSGVSPC